MISRTTTRFRALSLLSALAISLTLLARGVQAQSCAPVLNTPITVNGVVANLGAFSLTQCGGDKGWEGTIGRQFTLLGGTPGTQQVWVFVAGLSGGVSLSNVYIGIHVEGNAELNFDDKVLLYFDANNSGVFDVGDFAIFFQVGTGTTVSSLSPSPEDCNKDPNPPTPTIYRFTGGMNPWTAETPPALSIESKVAYDFSSVLPSDPENEIWELEVGLDVAKLNAAGLALNAPVQGNAFRMGAKVFVNEPGAMGTTAWKWPASASTNGNAGADTPNLDPTVTAAGLEPISFGNCGDVVIESISSEAPNLAGTGFDPNSFRVLNPGDFVGTSVPVAKQTRFHAKLRFETTPMGAPATIGAPNTGNGIFSLMPWGTNGALTTVVVRNQAEPFTQINTIRNIDFNWPLTKADYDQAGGFFNSQQSSHTCMMLQLQGYPVNINEPGDIMQRNLAYIRTSTVKENFLITAEKCKDDKNYKECRGDQEFIIHTRWANVPPDMQCGPNPTPRRAARCEARYRWTYIFPTANALGITHLGNGYYRVVLHEGQTIRVPVVIVGGIMPTEPQKFKVSPRAGGRIPNPPTGEPPVEIKVKPGKVVTIISTGRVNLGGIFKDRGNGPDGFSNREFTHQQREFLLRLGVFSPAEHIGALIGSFDGFKTSFVVGSNSSFIVPPEVDTLSLAVNDLAGQFDDNTGAGFEANVLIGDLTSLPTRVGLAGNPAFGLPGVVAAGANLPQLQIDAFRRLPFRTRKNATLRPAGYAVYAVFESHPKRTPVQPIRTRSVKRAHYRAPSGSSGLVQVVLATRTADQAKRSSASR